MGLIKLIKTGVFSALFDFSVPAVSVLLWAGFVVGLVVQLILNKKPAKLNGRYLLALIVVVLMLLCEFTQYGRILPGNQYVIYVYAILICMLVGLAIPAIALWIQNKKSPSKTSDGEQKPASEESEK
jgi:predicted membrane-bound spermidine synthase